MNQFFLLLQSYLQIKGCLSNSFCSFYVSIFPVRPKCSVSSPLAAPGLSGKTDLKHEGRMDTKETFKDEQHLKTDEERGFNSGLASQIGPVSTSAPLTCRRNSYIHSDKSKHKALGCKKLCRQNSLTSYVPKAGQTQSDMETALPNGETHASAPSGVCRSDPTEQFRIQDNNFSSEFKGLHGDGKESSESLSVKTNQQKEKQDLPVCLAVPDTAVEGNSDKEETVPATPNSSPVRKIKRKVKVYVRKRQKMDTPAEHVKPNDCSEDRLLKLMELFQDSDDTEGEFLGF